MKGIPIKLLTNANPAYVRKFDLGGIADLAYSIRRDGVVRPLLVQSDYLIIDGARRLEAVRWLSWASIPVIIVPDWNSLCQAWARLDGDPVIAVYDEGHRQPMRWLEVGDLVHRILAPLFQPERFKRATRNRKAGQKSAYKHGGYSNLEYEAAEFLHIEVAHLHAMRETDVQVRAAEANFPGWGATVAKHIEQYEENGARGGAAGLYTAITEARALARDGCYPTERGLPPADIAIANDQVKRIKAAMDIITAACHELSRIDPVNPAMDHEEARRLRYRLQVATRPLHKLRARLYDHIQTDIAERESDE